MTTAPVNVVYNTNDGKETIVTPATPLPVTLTSGSTDQDVNLVQVGGAAISAAVALDTPNTLSTGMTGVATASFNYTFNPNDGNFNKSYAAWADNLGAPGLPASGLMAYDSTGANWDRVRTVGGQSAGVITPNTGMLAVQMFGRFSDTESRSPTVQAFGNVDGNANNIQTLGTASVPQLFNGSNATNRGRDITGAISAGTGNMAVALAPHTAASGAITPVVTSAAAATLVIKNAAGNLYRAYAANTTATAGYLIILNATSAPADGAVTPLAVANLPANGTASIDLSGMPERFSTGITAVVTSAATPFTKTTGVITAFISGDAV